MGTLYPGAQDNLAVAWQDDTDAKSGADLGTSTTTGVHAQHHKDLGDAVTAIEATLGNNPQGIYVDVGTRLDAQDRKESCRAMATANVTIPPGGTSLVVDGVTMVNGDRVFLGRQTNPAENGVYVVSGVGSAVALTRSSDANSATKFSPSAWIAIEQGAEHRGSFWTLMTPPPITLGTTALRFTRIYPQYDMPISKPAAGTAWLPTNAILENLDREKVPLTNMAVATLTSGTIRAFPMGVLRAGDTATAINMYSGAASAGTAVGFWAGIARLSDRVVLARSNNSTAHWAAGTLRTFTFSSTYTADKDEHIVGFVMNNPGTTMPTLLGFLQTVITQAFAATPVLNGNSNTAQTATPVAVGAALTAFTAAAGTPYAFLT